MVDIKKAKDQIEALAKKYGLELLLLFGSRAGKKEYLYQESDFDIAYLSRKNLSLEEEIKLDCDLMPIFKSDRVDLTNLKRANPLLMKQIFDKHQVVYCRNQEVYSTYQVYAIRKYIEAKPIFDLTSHLVNRFIKKHA